MLQQQKNSMNPGVKCPGALFCRKHDGKFRTLARFRNHFDIAALPRYDLADQMQANAHALSWETVKSSGQSTVTAISFFSAAYMIPLMACV